MNTATLVVLNTTTAADYCWLLSSTMTIIIYT